MARGGDRSRCGMQRGTSHDRALHTVSVRVFSFFVFKFANEFVFKSEVRETNWFYVCKFEEEKTVYTRTCVSVKLVAEYSDVDGAATSQESFCKYHHTPGVAAAFSTSGMPLSKESSIKATWSVRGFLLLLQNHVIRYKLYLL